MPAPKAKQIKFDQDILNIIRHLEWSDDGLSCTINRELDRPTYNEVNKALVLLGGKWNRSAKAHLFSKDPRQNIIDLLSCGKIDKVRDGFFETPDEIISKMLSLITIRGKVLEPSAGLGAIANRIEEYSDDILCIEMNPDRANALKEQGYDTMCMDFMEFTGGYDTVIMNPPFENSQSIEHFRHAYNMLNKYGEIVCVVPESVVFREDKAHSEFRNWFHDLPMCYISEPIVNGFKSSGTGVSARIIYATKE